ncbi:hypothetical protein NIES4073_41250 [Kalymmatonema gypsitolerans NIES-4073]|jgi:hypothetical protein|nr:hypothetical protein NIES4073_41250 [Scytonema sp. NIES-4073]
MLYTSIADATSLIVVFQEMLTLLILKFRN